MTERKAGTADLSALRIDHDSDGDSRKPARMNRVLVAVVLVLLAGAALGYVCAGESRPSVTYKVTDVVRVYPSQSEAVLTASGYVVAQRQAAIASKGTGRLQFLRVEEGDEVSAGQVIAQLEHEDVDAALAQAQANLSMSRANLNQKNADFAEARINYERQQGLLAKGLISQAEFDIAEARFKSAAAAVEASKAEIELSLARLKSAQVEVENMRIRAPFAGTVLSKNADEGEMVAPFAASASSRAAVVTIADMSSLEVEADVSEANIHKVRTGLSCEIILDAFPDVRYPGFVHKIVPTADRAKATVMTKIRFREKDDRVLPEMSAKVNFLSGERTGDAGNAVTAVPASAVASRNGGKVVFQVQKNRANVVPVETGRKLGNRIEIISGVAPGDKVVLNPDEDLSDGAEIKTN